MASAHATLLSYIRGLEREAAALCAGNPMQMCFDQLLAHLIVREETSHALIEHYEQEVSAAAADLRSLVGATDGGDPAPALTREPSSQTSPEARFDAAAGYIERLMATAAQHAGDDNPELKRVASVLATAELRYYTSVQEAEQNVVAGFGTHEPASDVLTRDQVRECFTGVLGEWRDVQVAELALVPGLHSREVYLACLEDGAGRSLPLVIRRDREANLVPGSVADEFPIMTALFDRGLPVPEPISYSAEAVPLGRPYVAMSRLTGETPTVATLEAPEQALREIATILARFHDTPLEATGLAAGPDSARETWTRLIDEHHRWWHSIRPSASPSMEWAHRWLHDHIDVAAGETRLVHGDFHLRNFMVTDGHVTGLIDFELTKLGHPAEDLGAIRAEVEAVMSWEDFLAAYEDAGGTHVTPQELQFCDVWAAYRYRIICAMAGHLYATGQTNELFFSLAERLETPAMLASLVGALQRVSATDAPAAQRS